MKKIMILGAGTYQVPLINAAKKMGLYTVVVSIKGDYPGFQIADKEYYVDTKNEDQVLEIARKEAVDGILTTGTDVAVISIGRVCDSLGLCGVSYEGARIASNKILMKKALIENEVNTAQCCYVRVSEETDTILQKCYAIGYPVIFKAVDSSGSRGIVKVDNDDMVSEAIHIVQRVTMENTFIIEKFLTGIEFGAQAFIQGGVLEFILPHGDYVFDGDTGVPIGHYAPLDISDCMEDLFSQISMAVNAMHLDNCALNIDLILVDDKVYILEIGARGGATQLVELVSLYYGYNYYEKMIRTALGEKVSFKPENSIRVPNASHIFMSDRDGVIQRIDNLNVMDEDIIEIVFDYGIGDKVRKFRVGPDRIGHVIVKGKTLDLAQKKLFEVMRKVQWIIT